VRLVLFSLLTWLAVACLMVFLLQEERRHVERKAEADASAYRPCSKPGWQASSSASSRTSNTSP
jgi:hypothetical protein